MEAEPGDDEQTTEQPGRGSSKPPARITLGWPFFTYQLSMKGLLVVMAAGLAVVIIAAVFALVTAMGSGTSGAIEIRPFRLEATIVQTDSGGEFRSVTTMDWHDKQHYRSTTSIPATPGTTASIVADGAWRWHMLPSGPTYTRSDLSEIPFDEPDSRFRYMKFGPTTGEGSIDGLLHDMREQQKEFGPGKVRYARITGQETYLGIPVTVIEYGPLWNDSSPDKLANNWTINTGGSAKMWIDPETMFILRSEAEVRDGLSYLVEVTSFEFDPEFAPGTFTFVPPPDKTMVIE